MARFKNPWEIYPCLRTALFEYLVELPNLIAQIEMTKRFFYTSLP